MNDEEAIFTEAAAKPSPRERADFLDKACGGDAELRARVEVLLSADAQAGSFLESPPTGLATLDARSASDAPVGRPGTMVGPYKLLEQIGEGGMGVVFMAEQVHPVRRRVALKIIKPGMDTKSVIARFEAERQALAMMDHPNIAKVLDAGATDTGRPFFVMELVRGIKITDFCDQNSLSTGERLKLFSLVCHAIQHAHQKGIIHRDIKPSNILVTISEPGAPGCPKVIDFGIAKATSDQQLTDKTVFTAFEQFIGTPAYMSPEQAMMTSLDIDTRTDIYALGVLLYELLTGRTPFDARDLMAAGLEAMRRIISEKEPARPSTKLSTMLAADLTAIARHRQAEPARLTTLLRGDLDWIVMKCLEKDRGRRYETANGLALDIQRHLASEPVLACPPSAAYRCRKFARRNRAALVMASALGLAAIVTVVGLAISNERVRRESDEKEAALTRAIGEKTRADQNLSKARAAVKEYLLKTSENPVLQTGDFQGLRKELLETAIPFYEEFVRQDQQDPALDFERGRAYDDLGFLRDGMGDQVQAIADFKLAQEIHRRLAERFPDKPAYRHQLAEVHNSRGGVLKDLTQFDAAEAEFREALALMEPLLSLPGSPSEYLESLARIQGNLGLLMRESGRAPEGEPLLREAVAAREKLLEQTPDAMALRGQLSTSWNNLGIILDAQRKSGEAEEAFEKALGVLDAQAVKEIADSSPMHFRIQRLQAQAWNNLGMTRKEASRFAGAEAAYREALRIKERLADTFPSVPQHRQGLASTYNNLGVVVSSLDRPNEAQAAYEKAIHLYERLAADSPEGTGYAVTLAGTYSNMGRLIGDQGKLEESLPWIIKGIDILEDALRRDPRTTKARESLVTASWTRAMTLCGLERYSQALDDWSRAIEVDDGHYHQQLRLRRASNLLNLKDHVRAAADAAAVAEFAGASPKDLYAAAAIQALSAQLAQQEPALAESYAAQAVVMLRRALDMGYKDIGRIRTHPDLQALRSRGDFQQLIKELDSESGK